MSVKSFYKHSCYDCLWRGDCDDPKAGFLTAYCCGRWEYRYE